VSELAHRGRQFLVSKFYEGDNTEERRIAFQNSTRELVLQGKQNRVPKLHRGASTWRKNNHIPKLYNENRVVPNSVTNLQIAKQ